MDGEGARGRERVQEVLLRRERRAHKRARPQVEDDHRHAQLARELVVRVRPGSVKGLPVRGRRGGARADVRAGPARDVQKAAFLQKHQHRQHAAGVLAATTTASEDSVKRAIEVQGDVGRDELVPRNHSFPFRGPRSTSARSSP